MLSCLLEFLARSSAAKPLTANTGEVSLLAGIYVGNAHAVLFKIPHAVRGGKKLNTTNIAAIHKLA